MTSPYRWGAALALVAAVLIVTAGPAAANAHCKPKPQAHLGHCDLAGVNFAGMDLRGGNEDHANLTGADLVGTNFTASKMVAVILTDADLQSASLAKTDLKSAHLDGANLTDANLTGADLEADLTGVTWSNTTCPDGTNSDAGGGTCTTR